MSFVRKTITLTTQQDLWIKAQVEKGDYASDSEYIRELIRREQERRTHTETIRTALITGEASGDPRVLDVAAFKQRMAITRG